MTTARRRGLRVRHRCTEVNLAIGQGWIETRMASPARLSRAPSTPAVSSGGGAKVSPAPCASFATSRRRARRTSAGSGPVGQCFQRHRLR